MKAVTAGCAGRPATTIKAQECGAFWVSLTSWALKPASSSRTTCRISLTVAVVVMVSNGHVIWRAIVRANVAYAARSGALLLRLTSAAIAFYASACCNPCTFSALSY